MDRRMSKSIWWLKETVYWRTSLNYARSNMAIPNRNRCIKICNRSSPHSVRLKWRQTPNIIHIKNLFTSRTKLWNIWSWTTGNYSGIGRMATLYSRISPHHHYFIWSQKLDLLLRSQKLNRRQAWWSLYLLEFDVKLVHTPGNKMVQSDALPWRPDLCPDEDNGNEDIIILPDDMFLNLIDTNLQENIAMSNDLDGNAGKHSNSLWNKDQQQWQWAWMIGQLKPKMDETFYSTKGRITSPKIQIYNENWWNHFMIMKQQDTQGKLGHTMQYDSTIGGLDFAYL